MELSGIQKMTLLDFPGKCACTVFFSGCNLRCPFCHNASLVLGSPEPVMDEDAFFTFLKKRKGLLDGVCVTGGEPTLRRDLPDFIRRIKDMGYLVKLDTNGSNPRMLKELLEENLLDYVAMDIKNGPEQYAATCGLEKMDLTTIERSIRFLTGGAVDYDFRTTVVRELHNEASITQMGKWLQNVAGSPVKRLFLQGFVDRDTVKFAGLSAPDDAKMQQFQSILAPFAEIVKIRGSE